MKKIITTTASRLLLGVLLLITQFSAFAADGNTGDLTKWQVATSMPEFWIGVALFVVFISLFFIAGRNKNREAA